MTASRILTNSIPFEVTFDHFWTKHISAITGWVLVFRYGLSCSPAKNAKTGIKWKRETVNYSMFNSTFLKCSLSRTLKQNLWRHRRAFRYYVRAKRIALIFSWLNCIVVQLENFWFSRRSNGRIIYVQREIRLSYGSKHLLILWRIFRSRQPRLKKKFIYR